LQNAVTVTIKSEVKEALKAFSENSNEWSKDVKRYHAFAMQKLLWIGNQKRR